MSIVPTGRSRGGPKTPEGKRRSSLNALRHGLRSTMPLLPTESEAEYLTVARAIVADLGATGATETMLAERIVVARWKILRLRRYEAAHASVAHRKSERPASEAADIQVKLEILERHAGALDRALNDEAPFPRGAVKRRALLVDAYRAACFAVDLRYSGCGAEYRGLEAIKEHKPKERNPAIYTDNPARDAWEETAEVAHIVLCQQAAKFGIAADALTDSWWDSWDKLRDWLWERIGAARVELANMEERHTLAQAEALVPPGSFEHHAPEWIDMLDRRLTGELDRALRAFYDHREFRIRTNGAKPPI